MDLLKAAGPRQVGDGTSDSSSHTKRRHEGTFVSQHALRWEAGSSDSHAPSAPPSRSRTNIPSRYMGDLSAKINASRQRFNQGSASSASAGTAKAKVDQPPDEVGGKKIPRGKDFSQLLQKFSGSEHSGSEKSDSEAAPKRRGPVKRQEAREIISSSEDSEAGVRRTPERTQSLKMRASQPDDARNKGVDRGGSFRSEFMKKKFDHEESSGESKPASVLSVHDASRKQSDVKSDAGRNLAALDSSLAQLSKDTQNLDEPTPLPSVTEVSSSRQLNSMDAIVDAEQYIKDVNSHISVMSRSRENSQSESKDHDGLRPASRGRSSSDRAGSTDLTDRKSPDKSETDRKSSDKSKTDRKSPDKSETDRKSPNKSETDLRARSSSERTVSKDSTHCSEFAAMQRKFGRSSSERERLEHIVKPSEPAASHEGHREVSPLPPKSSDDSDSRVSPSRPTGFGGSLKVSSVSGVSQSPASPVPLGEAGSEMFSNSSSSLNAFDSSEGGDATVRRTSSFKDVTRTRSDSFEQRKGILKRTTSLPKQTSPTLVDPQLAKILHQRRQIQGDVEEEDEEKEETEKEREATMRRRSRALSAAEEIEETLQYSLQQLAKKGAKPEEDEALKRKSVADRIYSMQSKIEEEKFAASSVSKSRSGVSTPKSKPRSGFITPTQPHPGEEIISSSAAAASLSPAATSTTSTTNITTTPSTTAALCTTTATTPAPEHPELMERLTQIADASVAYEEKKKKFQQRQRDDWRCMTQPVTLEEIQAADSLQSVSEFRALVRKKASLNVFDQLQAQPAPCLPKGSKKAEYPQHIPPPRHQRRGRLTRHKTLPVTADELSAIPEGQLMPEALAAKEEDESVSVTRSRQTSEESDIDSILSQNADCLRSLSLEMDVSEDDPSRLSVSAKASIFKGLEEKSKAVKDKEKSASGAKRYIDRKKRERSRTQPVTEDEVKTAAEIAESPDSKTSSGPRAVVANLPQPEVVNRPRSRSTGHEEEQQNSEDELLKLSLTDKVKLFSQPKEREKVPPKQEAPVVRRRRRKEASRFSTQPVTHEEVQKASRISPLAMSMVRPPDPELLAGLPLKAQIDLMAQHAEQCLSQPASRTHSRSGSRSSLTADDLGDEGHEGHKGAQGILKDKSASAKDLHNVKSILKTEPSKASSETEVHSILKVDPSHSEDTKPVRSILKKSDSEEIVPKEADSQTKSIMKSAEGEEPAVTSRSRSNSREPEIVGILKHEEDAKSADVDDATPRSILKSKAAEKVDVEVKSALRKGSVDDALPPGESAHLKSAMRRDSHDSDSAELRSAMRRDSRDSQEGSKVKSALRRGSADASAEDDAEAGEADAAQAGQSKGILRHGSSFREKDRPDRSILKKAYSESGADAFRMSPGRDSTEDESGEDTKFYLSGDEDESPSADSETPRSSQETRKSRFANRKAKAERYRTQPPELTEQSEQPKRKFKYEGRHMTQPITPDEMREAEASTPSLTRTPGGSIADRLNQLKTSGEEGWKKRVEKNPDLEVSPSQVKLRDKKPGLIERPSSIVDRLNELERSKATWKNRVEETDVKQFTVAGKLGGTAPTSESPLVSKLKGLKDGSQENVSVTTSPLSSPINPNKEFITKIPMPKEIIKDPTVDVKPKKVEEEEQDKTEAVTVEVPRMGDELESFFTVRAPEEIKDKVELKVDDFNDIFIEAEEILTTVKRVRPTRRKAPSSRNPLKTMSQHLEVKQEYTQVTLGTAEKELRRIKTQELKNSAGLAQAALAGLASKENFKKVELRRSDPSSTPTALGQRFDPFTGCMLLHVKGRRMVQTRLVEPHTRSLNAGDSYILVTPDKVINWVGDFSNVIEKAKAAEVASYIQQKRDLGCKQAQAVATVTQNKDHLGAGKQFWGCIQGSKTVQACGPDAEDELYEASINKSNMVYKLEGNALNPVEEYWGAVPKHAMLNKNEVLVFDFGSEFYVWQGKAVTMDQRKLGLRLARQMFDRGYDYTQSVVNPLSPLRNEEDGGLPLKSTERPKWTIFGKVNQNMETILFREKFADWPDSSRLIGCKGHDTADAAPKDLQDLKAYDATKMIPPNTSPVTLKLEGANVGRGTKWAEDMQGFTRVQDILTLDVAAWHVMEYEHYRLPTTSHGQFHDGDTYVVRWQYMICNSGMKSLKGHAARNSLTGRERCAYFFWQGHDSTVNEKGASALMTVELDEERGPQVRVIQGKEPPCFLNLFEGSMMIHKGKREDPSTNTQGPWRLYSLRSDYDNEVCLVEIPVAVENLRSRSSLLLLNVKTGWGYVWHGAKSPPHVRSLALKAVHRLKDKPPQELGLHEDASIMIVEMDEGEEKSDIWGALGGRDRSLYYSLLMDPRPHTHTMRLFHMTSINLVFEVHEQLNPTRTAELGTPFPFLQSDLYKAAQPGLFLLDCGHVVYLWQGWWPVACEEQENVQTGSAKARFNMDRRCAMETTVSYCREKDPSRPPEAHIIYAGVEPLSFTNLFPLWEVDSTVKELALEDGRVEGFTEKVSEVLDKLSKMRYTMAELQERPLPEGVDPLRLESYLEDAEFEEWLDMTREEFYDQPGWKQKQMKQAVGLF